MLSGYTNPCLSALFVLFFFKTYFDRFWQFIFWVSRRWWQQTAACTKKSSFRQKVGLPSHKCEHTKASAIFFELNFYKQSGVTGSREAVPVLVFRRCRLMSQTSMTHRGCSWSLAIRQMPRFSAHRELHSCSQVTELLNFLDWLTHLSRFLHRLIIWIQVTYRTRLIPFDLWLRRMGVEVQVTLFDQIKRRSVIICFAVTILKNGQPVFNKPLILFNVTYCFSPLKFMV